MNRLSENWSEWFRPGRTLSPGELSFYTKGDQIVLLLRKETIVVSLIRNLFFLGIPICFVLVAIFKIDQFEPRLILMVMAGLVIFAVTGRTRITIDILRRTIDSEMRHWGIRTSVRRSRFSSDYRFAIRQMLRHKRPVLTLTDNIEWRDLFVVTDANEFNGILDELNQLIANDKTRSALPTENSEQ